MLSPSADADAASTILHFKGEQKIIDSMDNNNNKLGTTISSSTKKSIEIFSPC